MQRALAGTAVTHDDGMVDRSIACSVVAPRLRDQLVVPQAVVGALEGLAEQVLALQGLPLAPRHCAAQQFQQHPARAQFLFVYITGSQDKTHHCLLICMDHTVNCSRVGCSQCVPG